MKGTWMIAAVIAAVSVFTNQVVLMALFDLPAKEAFTRSFWFSGGFLFGCLFMYVEARHLASQPQDKP